ncbi:MAG TPA: phosphatidate cytidylyltransferase [Brevundimonas sp.]|uniref:phosphatidate cytidylyltransferase n=1 Tax=Brevundimonas sp. TaxID=1871086 RepID=UPI0026241576|nr:phosphatidate cytidylyltransferase [Brevundimonas sp.]HRO33620.1 phosphatidate cytidylyltransferase [Brevundimonas sp.]
MAVRVREMGMRTASAVVLAPLAVGAVWLGGPWILGVMLAACVLLSVEWARMSARDKWLPMFGAVAAALVASVATAHAAGLSFGLVLMVFGACLAGLFARTRGLSGVDAAYGVLYIGWPAILMIWLRDGTSAVGFYWVTLAFAVTWAADIAAYLVGSLVGGPKLWPRFSPNKTWSGFIGGLVAAVLAGMLMTTLPESGVPGPIWSGVLGLAGGLAAMAGDLWESALKRRFGVKDAGALIPGHGGLMDRVDGLMFAIVVIAGGRALVHYLGVGA